MEQQFSPEEIFARIDAYLIRLKNDRFAVCARLHEVEKQHAITVENSKLITLDEERDIFSEALESHTSVAEFVKNLIKELDDEIAHVETAYAGLRNTNPQVVWNAFGNFVLADTAHAIKNIGMALYDIDSLILSMREFNELNSDRW